VPPHIRLNSAQEDLITTDSTSQSRSLLSPRSSGQPLRTPLSQSHLFSSQLPHDSSERLLPPSGSGSSRLRDEHSSGNFPIRSSYSSRRSSWESERSRDSRGFDNPFRDSRPVSRAESDDENLNTQTVSEKYNILPSAGLLLFPEDVEKDDYLHNPDPSGKEPRDCDIFTRRGIVNVGGLALITIGILFLFIGYPVL
jgi:beta-glucan synthesis-associated protein KRE6